MDSAHCKELLWHSQSQTSLLPPSKNLPSVLDFRAVSLLADTHLFDIVFDDLETDCATCSE
jgi:hypothetical protein